MAFYEELTSLNIYIHRSQIWLYIRLVHGSQMSMVLKMALAYQWLNAVLIFDAIQLLRVLRWLIIHLRMKNVNGYVQRMSGSGRFHRERLCGLKAIRLRHRGLSGGPAQAPQWLSLVEGNPQQICCYTLERMYGSVDTLPLVQYPLQSTRNTKNNVVSLGRN